MLTLRQWRTPILQHVQGSGAPSQAPIQFKKGSSLDVQALILNTLEDAKTEQIFKVDLAGKSTLADQMIICSGRSARHVVAIAEHVLKALSENGYGKPRIEGINQGDWVLIDQGDVIIHIFRPEVRDFYNLEKIWGDHRPEEHKVEYKTLNS